MVKNNKTYNVFVCGFVGNIGTSVLIKEKRQELIRHFNEYYLDKVENYVKGGDIPSFVFDDNAVCDREPIGKGGFMPALWSICERNDVGLRYRLCDVPIMQGTIEICDFFDLNPYRLLTEKAYVFFSKQENFDSEYIVKIGETTNDKRRVRTDGEVESYLYRDYKDEINKIIPKYAK